MKYKVKDMATDLGVANKKITEILDKYCGVSKKTMTTLEESEIDVIFDVITKETAVDSFDSYFAARNAKLDAEPEKPAAKQEKKEEKPSKQQPQQEAPAAKAAERARAFRRGTRSRSLCRG